MPTDDERREVAARLRERTKKPMGKSMQRMFTETLGMYQHNICWRNPDKATNRWDVIVNYLADLIEPEERTCRMEPTGDGSVVCSACRTEYTSRWLHDGKYVERYCPNCGAKVDGE